MPTIATPYAPGGAGANWVNEEWLNELDIEAAERAKVYPLIRNEKAGHKKLHVPQRAMPSVTTAAETLDFTEGMTFTGATETEKTITPATVYIAEAINDNQIDRMAFDPRDDMKQTYVLAVGQKVDQDVCSLFTSLTTNIAGSYASDLDQSTVLYAQALVEEGGKMYAEDGQIYFAYHHRQGDNIRSITPFISAEVRGSNRSNAVTGKVDDVFGLKFIKTGNIRNSGGGFNNACFIKQFAAIFFNKKPTPEAQRRGAGWQLFITADYGYNTIRDGYAALVKSKNT